MTRVWCRRLRRAIVLRHRGVVVKRRSAMMRNGQGSCAPRWVVVAVALALALSAVAFGARPAVASSDHARSVAVVARGRRDVSTDFRTRQTGEVLIDITA